MLPRTQDEGNSVRLDDGGASGAIEDEWRVKLPGDVFVAGVEVELVVPGGLVEVEATGDDTDQRLEKSDDGSSVVSIPMTRDELVL